MSEPLKNEKLTPYQGSRRSFGLYTCPKCERKWASSHAWANMHQKCFICHAVSYAFRMWPLKKTKQKNGQKAHVASLCEKCQVLGFRCSQYRQEPKEENPKIKMPSKSSDASKKKGHLKNAAPKKLSNNVPKEEKRAESKPVLKKETK